MALLGQHNEPLLQGNADVEHQSINHLSFHDSTDDHKSTKCGNKYCTCCKGRLCKCTLISVAVTLGLVIAVMLSFIPISKKIAQHAMNKAVITMGDMNVTVLPGNNDHCVLSANVEMRNKASISAYLSNTHVTLHTEDGTKFGSFEFPPIKIAANGKTHTKINQVMKVENTTAFGNFSAGIFMTSSTKLGMKGTTSVSISMPFGSRFTVNGIDIDKSVKVEGASGFTGVQTENLSLTKSSDKQAVVEGAILLYNPSQAALIQKLGIGFEIYHKGYKIGEVLTSDGNVLQGWNTLAFRGTLSPIDENSTNRDAVQDVVSNYLGNKSTHVTCKGVVLKSTPKILAHALPYIQISTEMKPWNESVIDSVGISALDIIEKEEVAVASDKPRVFVHLYMNSSITVKNPLGPWSPIHIEELSFDVELFGNKLDVGELTTGKAVPTEREDGSWSRVSLEIGLSGRVDITSHETDWERFLDVFLSAEAVELDIISRNDTAFRIKLGSVLGLLDVAISTAPVKVLVPAMNSFGYVEVPHIDIAGTTRSMNGSQQLALSMEVLLDNPSVAKLPLPGRLRLDIMSPDGAFLGSSYGDDITLYQGHNVLQLKGSLCPCENLGAVSTLFSDYINGRNSLVQVQGVSLDSVEGAIPPLWLQHVVKHLRMNATVKGLSNFPVVGNMSALGVGFFWEAAHSPLLYGQFEVDVYLPFQGVEVAFGNAKQIDVDFYNPSGIFSGSARGPTITDIHICTNSTWYGKLITICRGTYTIDKVPLDVKDASALGGILKSVYESSDDVVVEVSFSAQQEIVLPIGKVNVHTEPIREAIPIRGMKQFSSPPLVGNNSRIVRGYQDRLIFNLTLYAHNPSQTFGFFGDVNTVVYAFGQPVGQAIMKNLDISPGLNVLLGVGILELPKNKSSPQAAAINQFLTNSFTQVPTHAHLVGKGKVSEIPAVQAAFEGTSTKAIIEGVPQPMLNNASFNICSLSFEEETIEIQIDMYNPLNVPLEIPSVNLTVWICKFMLPGECVNDEYSVLLGYFKVRETVDPPIFLEPYETMRTSKRLIYLKISFEVFVDVLLDDAFYGYIFSKVNGTVAAKAEDFRAPVGYSQMALPLYPDPSLPEAEKLPYCDLPLIRRRG